MWRNLPSHCEVTTPTRVSGASQTVKISLVPVDKGEGHIIDDSASLSNVIVSTFEVVAQFPSCVTLRRPRDIIPHIVIIDNITKPLKMEGRDVWPKMTEYLTAVNKMAQFEWTLSMVDLGHIPHGTPVTQADVVAKYPNLLGYDYLEKIGECLVPIILFGDFLRAKKCKTMEEFFDLNLYPADPNPSASLATEPVVPLRACYTDQIPRAAKKAKINMVVIDADEGQMGDDPTSTPNPSFSSWKSWPSFELCRKGDFAVVKIDYDGKGGIAVHKVPYFVLVSIAHDVTWIWPCNMLFPVF